MSLKLVDIDDPLWKEFKKKCFNAEVTMKEQLTNLIKDFVGDK